MYSRAVISDSEIDPKTGKALMDVTSDIIPVVGVALALIKGRIVQYPIFVLDGDLVNLEEARRIHWAEGTTIDETVVCEWPQQFDYRMLERQLDGLQDRACECEIQRVEAERDGGRGVPPEGVPE